MKRVLVLVKHVPTTEQVKMDPETGTMVRDGLDMTINPLDLHAVEEAIRIGERRHEDVDITAVTMGPLHAGDAVREAMAMGCTGALHLCSKAFGGSDTWATAYALSQGVRHVGRFDLILCGERATDGETGQVGPMVGAMLGVPVLTYVSRIDIAPGGQSIVAHRAVEGGHEIVQSPLPALVCVVKEINEPRLPTLRGKITARHADIPVWGPDEIGAETSLIGLEGSPTRVVSVTYPTLARAGELESVDQSSIEDCVDRLLRFLHEAQILEESKS